MIKKSVLALLTALFLLSNAAIVHAQKIYLFAGGDIQDPKIGSAVSLDINAFVYLFTENLPSDQIMVYNEWNSSWKGPEIFASGNVKNAILTAIHNCPARPTDTIVFYWSGHGAYDRLGHYLLLSKGGDSKMMYRSEILNALQQKGASLTVFITDSCQDFQEYKPTIRPPRPLRPAVSDNGHGRSGVPTIPVPRSIASPIFRSLFMHSRGVVNINSSRKGEKSYCSSSAGSVFTHNFFCSVLCCSDITMNWANLLDVVQNEIKKDGYDQNIDVMGNLPLSAISSRASNNDIPLPPGQWSMPRYAPEIGDRIIRVNNVDITDEDHFRQVISDTDTHVLLTLVDKRSKRTYQMVTELLPHGLFNRLGIDVRNDPLGGVVVTDAVSGLPGTMCRYLIDGSVYPVRSNRKK